MPNRKQKPYQIHHKQIQVKISTTTGNDKGKRQIQLLGNHRRDGLLYYLDYKISPLPGILKINLGGDRQNFFYLFSSDSGIFHTQSSFTQITLNKIHPAEFRPPFQCSTVNTIIQNPMIRRFTFIVSI